jgi:cation transport regulator
MPYRVNRDLPASVTNNLPPHAQSIYREAFNHSWKEYEDAKKRRGNASHEEVSHKVAWAAVKKEYEKGAGGKWHKKAA